MGIDLRHLKADQHPRLDGNEEIHILIFTHKATRGERLLDLHFCIYIYIYIHILYNIYYTLYIIYYILYIVYIIYYILYIVYIIYYI